MHFRCSGRPFHCRSTCTAREINQMQLSCYSDREELLGCLINCVSSICERVSLIFPRTRRLTCFLGLSWLPCFLALRVRLMSRPEEYRKRNIAANDGRVQENCTDPYLPCAAFAQVKLIEPGLHEIGIHGQEAVAEEEGGDAG